jgi:hypothetical protein
MFGAGQIIKIVAILIIVLVVAGGLYYITDLKAALVTSQMNEQRGTKNALRCLELATGSPLTEEEKNAPTPLEANRECPALINPNYSSAN